MMLLDCFWEPNGSQSSISRLKLGEKDRMPAYVAGTAPCWSIRQARCVAGGHGAITRP